MSNPVNDVLGHVKGPRVHGIYDPVKTVGFDCIKGFEKVPIEAVYVNPQDGMVLIFG